MTFKTDLSVAPYYDDYKESKKFHRILFRPGYSVQAREVNQLQTILQNQIERFGDSIYKEGAVVIPGGYRTSSQEISLGVELTGALTATLLNTYTKLYARSTTTNRRMLVSGVFDGDANHGAFIMGALTFAGNATDYTVGEVLSLELVGEDGTTSTLGGATIGSVGNGTLATIEKGVMYLRGAFVLIERQQLILNAYSEFMDGVVGLVVNEDIIAAAEDSTLYSNAQGVSNEKAEGANRLTLALTLSKFERSAVPDNFIQLSRFTNGIESVPVTNTVYSLLEDSLAQRTYEESGDYTVDRYTVKMKEFGDVYTTTPDETKMVAVLSAGRSYVRGHRIQNTGNVLLTVDKARDTEVAESVVVGVNYGYYVTLTSSIGIPEFGSEDRVAFYDASNNRVATAIIVGFKNSRLYLVDIQNDTGRRLLDAVRCVQLDSAVTAFVGQMENGTISGADKKSLLFPLPYSGAMTMAPSGAESAIYRISRSYAVTLTNGVGTITSGSSTLLFDPDTDDFVLGTRGSDSVGDYYEATYARGGSTVGTSLTVTAADTSLNGTYYVLAKMIQRAVSPKSKTKRTITETVVMSGSSFVELGHEDGISLDAVTESGNDVISEFTFDGGQRDNRYMLSRITSSQGVQSSRTLQVTYTYFAHSVGDYFNVDSYSSLDRSEAVEYTDESGSVWDLRDSVDFRPSVGTTSVSNFVYPDSTFTADLQIYLPRVDTIAVSYENGYQVIKGISSQSPKRPSIPSNAMRLYDVHVPAYTASTNDVVLGEDNRQRYTMQDIANLEKRIENVEYYTSLSSLENSAYNVQAVDPVTGQNRFKNGIFADPMKDFRLIDYDKSDFSLETMSEEGGLYPRIIRQSVDFGLTSGGVVDSNMVLPAYTEVEDTVQPYATATININPYAIFRWVGTVTINPASYYWVESQYLDPIYVNAVSGSPDDIKTGSVRKIVDNVWITKHNRYNLWRTTTTTLKTWTETTSSDVVVQSELIPYMRSIDIAFTVNGMRPSTDLNIYFAGINVNSFVQPDGGNTGDQLTTDTNGVCSGVFHLPSTDENKFEVGESSFVVTDSPTSSFDGDTDYSTAAQTTFNSGGTLNIRQVTETTTRYYGAEVTITEKREYYDPVAQSFLVSSAGGAFISSVDIFFATKSDSIPVRVELRKMENGYPTMEKIAVAWVLPENVNVSNICDVATNFKFPYPVFLNENTEYCFVVASDSQAYEIGYCELGGTVLGDTFAVSKQPNIGIMFTSANNSTWTANQMRDVKFNLNRCSFGTGTVTMLFNPTEAAGYRGLGANPISGVAGESEITIQHEAHGLSAGDEVTLRNSSAGLGLTAAQINTTLTISEVVDFDSYKVSVDAPLTESGIIYQPTNTPVEVRSKLTFVQMEFNADILDNDAVSLAWQYKYTNASGLSVWNDFTMLDSFMALSRGYYDETDDLQLRAVMTYTDNIAPQIDLESFSAMINNYYVDIDQDKPRFVYTSEAMYFSNPCTNVQYYMAITLPGSSTFKSFVKVVESDEEEDGDWVEVKPTQTIVNSNDQQEYSFEYDTLESGDSFSGLRVKFEFYSEGVDEISVANLRGVVFA